MKRSQNPKKPFVKWLWIGVVVVLATAFFISSLGGVDREAVEKNISIVETTESVEGSQVIYRILLNETDEKDVKNALDYMIDKDGKEGLDSIMITFNENKDGEIGPLVAKGKKAWTNKGKIQLGVDTKDPIIE